MLLNLEPDHLDRHGSYDAYRDAKLRIFENQTEADVAIVPRDFEAVPGGADRVEFRADDPLPAEPLIPGEHNRENAAAATAAARAAGHRRGRDRRGACARFPASRTGSSSSAELDGVRFVNDSKATNTAAARRGIAAYAGQPLRLILGGSLKGESFDELAEELPASVRSIDLIGEATEELARVAWRARAARSAAPATSQRPWAPLQETPSRVTSCCCRPRARATTSSATSRSAGRRSADSSGELW